MKATMEKVSHLLLTRFNVKLQFDVSPEEQSAKQMGLNEGWLARRFGLFETYCLPSVASQTRKDFTWLVYLDEATPEFFRKRMFELASQHSFLKPLYCSEFDASDVWRGIDSNERGDETLRITSRLDNDDMLHPRYLEYVRARAEKEAARQDLQQGFFVAFPLGYCLREGDGYVQRYRNNPFSSYVSGIGVRRTALDLDHRYIGNDAVVVYEWRRPMWCQVIHGENVANGVRGVYWPFGREFERRSPSKTPRRWRWKAKEMVRSARLYWRNRGT